MDARTESCRASKPTAMQDDVVDHAVPVLRLVEAERTAQVFLASRFRLASRVTHLHVHFQGLPKKRAGGTSV